MGGEHQVNIKLSDAEFEQLERLQRRMEDLGKIPGEPTKGPRQKLRFSQRQVILAGLNALEVLYNKLDTDRDRPR